MEKHVFPVSKKNAKTSGSSDSNLLLQFQSVSGSSVRHWQYFTDISIYIYKMYHVEITGTVTEGKEREQSDLISRCSQSSPEIAHVPLYLH